MSGWTEARVLLLRQYWADGYSGSQIAKLLGGGVTRNAVIGKVHRLNLTPRATAPSWSRYPGVRRRPTPPRQISLPVLECAPQLAAPKPKRVYEPVNRRDEPIPRFDLHVNDDEGCRWIVGDPRMAHAKRCGHARHEDTPYCKHHFMRAWVPQQKPSKKAVRA